MFSSELMSGELQVVHYLPYVKVCVSSFLFPIFSSPIFDAIVSGSVDTDLKTIFI